jgi:hypothetical protein
MTPSGEDREDDPASGAAPGPEPVPPAPAAPDVADEWLITPAPGRGACPERGRCLRLHAAGAGATPARLPRVDSRWSEPLGAPVAGR